VMSICGLVISTCCITLSLGETEEEHLTGDVHRQFGCVVYSGQFGCAVYSRQFGCAVYSGQFGCAVYSGQFGCAVYSGQFGCVAEFFLVAESAPK
jgi:hypothetical protein